MSKVAALGSAPGTRPLAVGLTRRLSTLWDEGPFPSGLSAPLD